MKKQNVLRSKAKKAEKAFESLTNTNEKAENTDDAELTEEQLDTVSGGTINPAVIKGDDNG